MWNRYQIGQSGFLTAIALCGALSFTACSGDDDDDVADGAVRDSSADARGDAARPDAARTDAEAGPAGDARVADVSTDVTAEARGPEAGGDATRADADATVIDTGIDVRVDAADGGAPDARDAALAIDTGIDVRVDTGVTIDTGIDVRVDAGIDVGIDTGLITVDAGPDATATVDARSDAAEAAGDAGTLTLRYDWETAGDTLDWTTSGDAAVSIDPSTTVFNTGARSLRVGITGVGTATHEITIYPSTAESASLASGRLTFSVYVPAGSTLTLLKVFDETNDDQASREEVIVPFDPIADVGAWKTYTVTFPVTVATEAGVEPRDEIEQLGIQFEGTGVFYLDTFRF